MTDATTSLSEQMIQVRNAYRLVVAYQRRLLDIVKMTKMQLQKQHRGLAFYRWGPNKWSRPGVQDPTQKWAWDFVPLCQCDIGWVTSALPVPGSFWVWLTHEGDSGWNTEVPGEPDPLTFKPAEECHTRLHAGVLGVTGLTIGAEALGDWFGLYDALEPKLTPERLSAGFEDNAAAAVARIRELAVNVEELSSPELVTKKLIEPLLEFAGWASESSVG